MQAINYYVVVDKIKEAPKTVGGLELTEDQNKDVRYLKAKVISAGPMADVLKKGDIVRYDKHAGHGIQWQDIDFSDGLAAAVEAYQMGHNETRAMYVYKPEINGLFDLFLFMPISLLQYLLEPMPWRIATGLDLALFVENIVRCLFIFLSVKAFFTVKQYLKTPLVFLILTFFAIEMLWALGTVNWGSAVRHHIPGMGILMIIGICFLDPNLHIFKNSKTQNRVKNL